MQTATELQEGLAHIGASPKDAGTLELIVRRPAENEREVLDAGQLDLDLGLVGDMWHVHGTPNPDAQLTLMNARSAELIAEGKDRWPLAGDQLYVDFDLSVENLPPGTRVSVGDAVVEVTALPHTGCGKFTARFGSDAVKFVNQPPGRALRLRGVNAKVVTPGVIRVGDVVNKQ